ncbi:MAG: YvrJ family protein [Firmicutes bacterium]|jgi:hypothetical protein|nr:YvrJ family protein [Bacillota bacterium]
MEELLKAIGNFGFPMVVSVYLLIRVEARLDRLANSITELDAGLRSLQNQPEPTHTSDRRGHPTR